MDPETRDSVGEIEVLGRLNGEAGMRNAYDDFCVDERGDAFIAVHSGTVEKVTSEGIRTTIAGEEKGEGVVLRDPTSCVMAGDGKSFYLCTGGSVVDGVKFGGQVVRIKC
jgi:hypothetical protein